MTSGSSRHLYKAIRYSASDDLEEELYSSHDKLSLRGLLVGLLSSASLWCLVRWNNNRFESLTEEEKQAELDSQSVMVLSFAKYQLIFAVPLILCWLMHWLITGSHLYYYWSTVKRSSPTTLRLSALRSNLSHQSERLTAIIGTSGDDGTEPQINTSESSLTQLHDLLGESDLDQLQKQIGRLRDACKRLNNTARQIDQSWERRIFDMLWPNMYSKEGGANLSSTTFDDQIMKDLHESVKQVAICPLPAVSRTRDWERANETQDLVDKAETAIESIQYLIDKVPESKILPGLDFDKFAVVAYWEFPVSNPQKATATTTPEIFWDDPVYDSNVPFLSYESELGKHPRKEVPKSALSPGGHFRGICKLKMTVATPSGLVYAHGTGWLIDASTVVTAGHNLYDSSGYATEVLVQLGVHGELADPIVEKRYGRCTAVHWGYYGAARRRYDFALIKLRDPFKDCVSIAFNKPALTGSNVHLQVVGYPGDLSGLGDSRTGFRMYMSEASVTYNLKQDGSLICHPLDTYYGNSGGPILQVDSHDGSFKAIGVHCYGIAAHGSLNSGPALGYNGNDINAFVAAMNLAESGAAFGAASLTSVSSSTVPGLKMIKVPLSTP